MKLRWEVRPFRTADFDCSRSGSRKSVTNLSCPKDAATLATLAWLFTQHGDEIDPGSSPRWQIRSEQRDGEERQPDW